MPKRGKNYKGVAEKTEKVPHGITDAMGKLQELGFAKFDETVEIAMLLGVDPRHADQMVRGTVTLPHGTGKTLRVLAICGGEALQAAKDAGADLVMSGEEAVEKISGGFLDFDAVVATPDMMRFIGRLGKVLGPRGMMPNPKTGTVTPNIADAVQQIKAGKVEFRVDRTAIVHAPIGKVSFGHEKLMDNAQSLIDSVIKAKPAAAKGRYIRSVYVGTTMSPSIEVDLAEVDKLGSAATE